MQAIRLFARDLACRRGERILFRNLDIALESGGILHITGANGVGKSSLIRILARLLPPYAGSVEHDAPIALLDENPALDPDIALRDSLKFWADIDDTDVDDAAVDRLGLSRLMDVPFRYLSTGQKKRAAFARILQQGAAIWLLDEPMNGLDPDGRNTIEQLIVDHSGAAGICVLASHQAVSFTEMKTLALGDHAP